jgi:hypothetical protein
LQILKIMIRLGWLRWMLMAIFQTCTTSGMAYKMHGRVGDSLI